MREDEALAKIKRPKRIESNADLEQFSEAEQKLISNLHLSPKTLDQIKDNVSQQIYAYGLLNPGQAGQQFLRYRVDEDGKLEATYSWPRKDLKLPSR